MILVLLKCTKSISGGAFDASLGSVLDTVKEKVSLADVSGCSSLAVSVIV
jgi:hypothetical protein